MKRFLFLVLALAGCGDNLTIPPDRDPATDPDPLPLGCVPNLDGRIDASELQPAIGTQISYVVSPPGVSRSIDVVGTTTDGEPAWDFATDYADDQSLVVVPANLSGKWYAASFPEGAFVTPFNREGTLESIGMAREDAIVLLGLASKEADPAEGRTLLVYTTPIVVLSLPVEAGQTYTSVGEIVNGTVQGLPYAGRDTYEVSVDAVGEIDLPQLTFEEVHRVRTKVTVEPAVGTSVVRRQVSFYAECFAEVARATSADDETEENFTQAAELRRLGQ
ncbi:MAG: hypothetical protein HOV80_20815 [Polyangiaceae bacterium]|nr:hypothetical protein [Polyangiaceae bacterium]